LSANLLVTEDIEDQAMIQPAQRHASSGADEIEGLETAQNLALAVRFQPFLSETQMKFSTIPLQCGYASTVGMLLKRTFDVVFSSVVLIFLSPVFLAIAVAIKLDSRGNIIYFSERVGKKGCVFHCFKFRTMVHDAEKRRAEVMHMNERDGVAVQDHQRSPDHKNRQVSAQVFARRVAPVLQCAAWRYERRRSSSAHHQRGAAVQTQPTAPLDVHPGITGLWQVQCRQDPSFDSYISLDFDYIESQSIWLDLKIIARTIMVVIAGNGLVERQLPQFQNLSTLAGFNYFALDSFNSPFLSVVSSASRAQGNSPIVKKPMPGLFEQVVAEFPDVTAGASVMIGDSLSDIEFGRT